jgi:plasmid stabilization system protein ParE
MIRIVWSQKSLRDLDAIQAYVSTFSPTAASRLVQKIIRRTDRLMAYPNSGGLVEEDEAH